MQHAPETASFFKDPGGRLRFGWRVLFFALLTFTLGAGATFVIPSGRLASSAAILVGAVAAGVLVLALDGRPAGALGFYIAREAVPASLLGLALGVAVAGVVVAAIAVAGGLVWTSQPGSAGAWLAGGVGALFFFAIPAAAEEAFLRGYLIQALAEEWGPWPGILVTAGAIISESDALKTP